MDDYVETPNDEGAPFLTATECMNLKQNGGVVGRSFRDIAIISTTP
jgi:hypothetical protein